MGQGTNGLGEGTDRAEREVREVRERLTGIAGELDRRRHAALDMRGRLRRHGPAVGVSATTLVLLVGGTIWLGARARRRRARPLANARRLRWAVARMIAHPDDVARARPGMGKKALAALISAITGVLAKVLTRRLLARRAPVRELPAT
jgi:hypothetical protein